MMKLPRKSAAASRQPDQPPAFMAPSGASDSPTGVLSGLPLQQSRSKSTKSASRPSDRSLTNLDGHAVDVVHLLHAGWFGPMSRSKAAELFGRPTQDAEPAMLPARRGRQSQQQQQQQQRSTHRASDASPSTSSQRSGGSSSQLVTGGSIGSIAATAEAAAVASSTSAHPNGSSTQQQAEAVQGLPGIGTWAGRYRLFGRKHLGEAQESSTAAAAQHQPCSPPAAAGGKLVAAEQRRHGANGASVALDSPVVLRPGGFDEAAERGAGHGRFAAQYGSEEAQEDAWRWRFSRKWATEQKRYHEQPGLPTSIVSDDLDALEFTQACGIGLNLQVMPTSGPGRPLKSAASADEDGGLALEASTSTLSLCQFDVDQSETTMGLLAAEMSPGNSGHGARAAAHLLHRTASGTGWQRLQQQQQQQRQVQQPLRGQGAPSPRLPSATRSVLSIASKAQELLRKQGAIEQEVQDRWEKSCTAGDAWAGRKLRAVQIDMWGRFKYCVFRVSDGAGHKRFIVRGRAGASPAALLEGASQEAAEASRSCSLPTAVVEVVGAGIMEWREDTERELLLMPATLRPGDVGLEGVLGSSGSSDSPTKSSSYLGDVSGLTVSLVRQALPCHFRITTAASASRASSAAALNNRV